MAAVATAIVAATAASPASAAGPPSARALAADVERVSDGLSLLGRRPSSPLGRVERLRVFQLRLANRDGYRFAVVAYGQTVALSVSNRRRDRPSAEARRASNTVYLSHGTVTGSRIEAVFGTLGEIDVRFRPSGRYLRATRRAGCVRAGRRAIASLGLFVGGFRFRGEAGYTSVRAHRVLGASTNVKALSQCSSGLEPLRDRALLPQRGPSPLGAAAALSRATGTGGGPEVGVDPSAGPRPTTLSASLVAPLTRRVFGARAGADGAPVFLAAEQSIEGRLGIVRLVSARGRADSFEFDDALTAAAVAPPPPFRGRGVFEHGPGNERSWTGSLAVTFLGAPRVALVDEPFRPRLGRGW